MILRQTDRQTERQRNRETETQREEQKEHDDMYYHTTTKLVNTALIIFTLLFTPSFTQTLFCFSQHQVVDTPDMTTAGMKQKEKKAEVARWKELASPYASVLLLVIRSDVPYTEEDFIVYRQIRRFWGKGSARERLVVVFTFADGQDVDEVGERMESESPKWMGKIFKDSGGRFLVFKGKVSVFCVDIVLTSRYDRGHKR